MYIAKNVDAMTGYTPGEQPTITGIIKLNTNENPYPPCAAIGEALAEFNWPRLRLYPDPLCKALRERIAAIHACSPDQIFIGNGSDEILALCTRAFVENDGSIGYFVPSYSLYPVLADIRGVEKRPVQLDDTFTWQMPDGYQTSLFLIANPNAPTSLQFPKQNIADFAKTLNGVVLIDEAYADFAPENCMSLAIARDNANTLVLRTLSKSYSLAGLRFGYVIGPTPLIAALYKVKDSYNIDMITQAVAFAALNDLDSMQNNARKIIATRKRLTRTLRTAGWQVHDSASNFLFARPPADNAEEIFQVLMQNKIYVRYFPGPQTGHYLRITIGTDDEINTLLTVLGLAPA